jgi:WD40 repeat protein
MIVRLWNVKKKLQEAVFEGHTGYIECVAITSNNRYIFSGSGDNTVRLWNVKEKRQEAVLRY